MRALLLLLLAAAARAQLTTPPPSVTQLHDSFLEAVDEQRKAELVEAISTTAPASNRDIQALFDLFMRYPDERVRRGVLASLQLTNPRSPSLEDQFLRYLSEPEPDAVMFGIKGSLRIKAPAALPIITKLARKPFAFRSPHDTPLLSDKNAWWVQYQALEALAQWEGEAALPLLRQKAQEAPLVARLLGLYFWKQCLPDFAGWAASASAAKRERAKEALTAPVPRAALRETREAMLKYLRDPKADKEVRHQLAIKLGITSTEEEVGALLREYQGLKDPQDRLMFSAALFASGSRQVIPLLTQYAKENPDPHTRAGARFQLKELLAPAEYKALLDWAAKNDPDPDNRQDAAREQSLALPQ